MRRLAWVSLVLVASLGALGVFNIRLQRQQLETARRNAAERMSDVIRRATTYTMLRNDRAALAEIVSMIGRDPSIAGLRIVDAGGRVRLSTPPREAGHVMPVILISGWPDDIYGCPEEQMVSRVMVKPVPIPELFETIRQLTG